MKQRIRFAIPVLALLGLACDSAFKVQYQAEKDYYAATKLQERVLINPRVANQLDYKLAIDAYEDLIRKYPADSYSITIDVARKQSFVAVAELWTMQGETQKAIQVYDRFLAEYPHDKKISPMVHFANARSNERIYNIDKAISEYKTLIDDFSELSDPLTPSPTFLNLPLRVARLERAKAIGPGKVRQTYYQKALDYYSRVAKDNAGTPAAFAAIYYTASVYHDQQQWQDALHTLRRLVKEFPDREEIPNIVLTIANLYAEGLNKPREAEKLLRNLIKKYPDHSIEGYIHFARARILQMSGRTEENRQLLKWILEEYAEDENLCASAQLALAYTYDAAGDWDRALVEYRWVQEKYPTTPQGLFVPNYIGRTYLRKSQSALANAAFKDAIEHYGSIIKKFPKTVLAGTAQEFVIQAYAAQEDWENAERAVSALETIFPGSRSQITTALLLGRIYEQSQLTNKAIDVYEKFMAEFPNHPILSQLKERVGTLRSSL